MQVTSGIRIGWQGSTSFAIGLNFRVLHKPYMVSSLLLYVFENLKLILKDNFYTKVHQIFELSSLKYHVYLWGKQQ